MYGRFFQQEKFDPKVAVGVSSLSTAVVVAYMLTQGPRDEGPRLPPYSAAGNMAVQSEAAVSPPAHTSKSFLKDMPPSYTPFPR